jgi:hypothetical protein
MRRRTMPDTETRDANPEFRALLASYGGRAVLYDLFVIAGVLEVRGIDEPLTQAYNNGRRDLMLPLFEAMIISSPKTWNLMEQEARDRSNTQEQDDEDL